MNRDNSIQVWQNRLTPAQKIIAGGCHLNQEIDAIVKRQFINVSIEQFYAPKLPKLIGYMYRGVAIE